MFKRLYTYNVYMHKIILEVIVKITMVTGCINVVRNIIIIVSDYYKINHDIYILIT
jgi:hypothetical protein